MKKIIPVVIIALILICPIFAEEAHATTVFLTSDKIMGDNEDLKMLNDIKEKIETKSNGQITVILDSNAPSSGETSRVMESESDIAVTIASACAGNLVDLAGYSTRVTRKIIYVNAGSIDLSSVNFLRRSYDDNFSSSSFASIQNPGQFLYDSGIILLQPGQRFYDQTDHGNLDYSSSDINDYIADEVLKAVYSNGVARKFDENLINRHELDPKYLAEDSAKIANSKGSPMEASYGSYTTQQLLYMSASYLVGYGLKVPGSFEAPDNPSEYSFLTKGSYSFNEYCEMADIVVDYMNEHGKAPDSISYKGATIGYYDLVYNFALLAQDDFDSAHMNFPHKASFQRYNSNILLDILPIAVIIVVIIAMIIIIRKVYRKIKRFYKKLRNRNKDNNYYRSQTRNNNYSRRREYSNDYQSRSSRPSNQRKKKKSTRIFHNSVDLDPYEDYPRSNEPKRLYKKR